MLIAVIKGAAVIFVLTMVGVSALLIPNPEQDETPSTRSPGQSWRMPGDAGVYGLEWSPTAGIVARVNACRAGEDNVIILDPEYPHAELMCADGVPEACCVAVLPDGRLVAGSPMDSLLLREGGRWRQLTALGSSDAAAIHQLCALDSHRIVVGGRDQAELFDIRGRRLWERPVVATVHSLSGTADGRLLVIGTQDSLVLLIETATGQVTRTISTRLCGNVAAITPDGRYVIIGAYDGSVTLWDVARAEIVWIRSSGEALVTDISLSPDGSRFAMAGQDVSVWNLCGDLLESIPVRHARCVRFSPEGDRLALGTWDGVLEIHKLRVPPPTLSGSNLLRDSL
jgi:WD40 repeat protein